jgi:simple sugar transport system permease protein
MLISKSFSQLLRVAIVLAAVAVISTACKKDDEATPQTITDIVLANNDFTLLRAAVQRAGLADALRSGSLTVFAPNDAAFRASGFADVAAINAAPVATLTAILQYHVLGARTAASAIPTAENTQVTTLGNVPAFITKNAAGVSVNGVRVAATTAGGFIAGLGGASLSLYFPGSWNEALSSGQGLIAVALVIFARWHPVRCLWAALLFGGAGALGPALQSVGVTGYYHLFNAVPYVLTLAILVWACSPRRSLQGAPAELGVSH